MENILYISLSILPSRYANSVHVMKMCSALNRHHIKTSLIATKGLENNIFQFYNVENKFNVELVNSPNNKFLRAINYNFYCFRRIFQHDGLIYLRYIYPILWCLLFRKSVVMEFHNIPQSRFHKFLIKQLFNSKSLKAAVFITHSLKSYYASNFKTNIDKFIVLPDCCDIPKKTIENTEKIFDIGYVGHLYEGRGTEIILELAKRLPNCVFHIIGGREKDINHFRKLSPSNVIYYGFVNQMELIDLYSKFTIVLAPYQLKVRSAIEGSDSVNWMSPMKIFEYMAFKKAIILSDLPALREIGENEKHFLFVKPTDIDEWLEAIILLQKNTKFRNNLIENSFLHLQNEYTWDNRVARLLKFITKK